MSSRDFRGRAAVTGRGAYRITHYDASPALDFGRLVDQTRSDEYYNSPIYALDKFFVGIKSSPLWTEGFYQPNVPLFISIHSANADKFQVLAQNTPAAQATAQQMGQAFVDYHAQFKKPVHVYVRDTFCDDTIGKTYRDLVGPTGGTVLSSHPCQKPVDPALDWLAERVVEQSRRYRKHRLALARVPGDPRTLRVFMRHAGQDTLLKGGTGAADDQWSYDAAKNHVLIHWWKIRMAYRADQDAIVVKH